MADLPGDRGGPGRHLLPGVRRDRGRHGRAAALERRPPGRPRHVRRSQPRPLPLVVPELQLVRSQHQGRHHGRRCHARRDRALLRRPGGRRLRGRADRRLLVVRPGHRPARPEPGGERGDRRFRVLPRGGGGRHLGAGRPAGRGCRPFAVSHSPVGREVARQHGRRPLHGYGLPRRRRRQRQRPEERAAGRPDGHGRHRIVTSPSAPTSATWTGTTGDSASRRPASSRRH